MICKKKIIRLISKFLSNIFVQKGKKQKMI